MTGDQIMKEYGVHDEQGKFVSLNLTPEQCSEIETKMKESLISIGMELSAPPKTVTPEELDATFAPVLKIVHKFTGPSIEVIACKDAEWTGYGADNWEKVNCTKCLAFKGADEC